MTQPTDDDLPDFDMKGIVLFMLLDLAMRQAEQLGERSIRITREHYKEAIARRNFAGIGMQSDPDTIFVTFVDLDGMLPGGRTGQPDCPACEVMRKAAMDRWN